MKVLICVDQLDWRGAEILGCRLAVRLNQLVGWEAQLACRKSLSYMEASAAKQKWESLGLKVHPLEFNSLFQFPSAYNGLKGLIRKEKFDLIETSSTPMDVLASICSRVEHIPHVTGIHDYFDPEILSRPLQRFRKSLINETSFFYSVSTFAFNRLVNESGFPAAKSRMIYNSIEDSNGFSIKNKVSIRAKYRRILNCDSRCRILLHVGRILPRKGIDVLIDSVAPILKNKNALLVILGPTPKEGELMEAGASNFVRNLHEKIRSYSLKEKVRFLGFDANVRDWMVAADCLVHTARHEAFGLVLLEAIAAKLPIVATDVGGIPEVLKNTPYKPIQISNIRGIQDEVLKFTEISDEKREKVVESARPRLSVFSEERRNSEMRKFYLDILKRSRR